MAIKQIRPTIIRLLSNMASTREIQLYLQRFSQLEADRFAVVKVGGAVLRDELDALVSSLAFLQQVGLTPIVVHGAGPQLDDEMEAAGIAKEVVEGLRVTTPEGLTVVRRVTQRENLRVVEALQSAGVRATSIHGGVFESELLDAEVYGLVGRVVEVHIDGIEAAISADSIPVIASLGETGGGQIVNVNADWAANELVKKMQPYKIIFLTQTGGLLDEDGHLIESISLSTQYEDLMRQPWVHSGMRVKMEQIHDLLMELPPASSLSITRPSEMAKELFTHRGSGTLVRRGERIHRFDSWEGVDQERFRVLLESGFGRSPAPDYFDITRPLRVYVSEHYRAGIVLVEDESSVYMDKFVVSEDAQGEGLGRAMWEAMHGETPELVWRSRPGNPVNDFYFANAEGALRGEDWVVFWYGIEDLERVGRAAGRARARPATI
ncbi:MAG: acetylglutamate kinase [Gemmatimonadota bacterium]